MLALMPMVDRALDDLGVRERYRAGSIPFGRYGVHSHTGRLLREDSMAPIFDRYGDYRGIETAQVRSRDRRRPHPLADTHTRSRRSARPLLSRASAAGFLPTAGIGAGMAMESAWVLGRMLRRATRDNLAPLLAAFEAAQRPRVEAAQSNSRSLAAMMFRPGLTLAVLRDLAVRFVSVKVALKPIQRLLATMPDPDRIAADFESARR